MDFGQYTRASPNKDVDTAKEIMIEILNKGRGVAGAYSFEVAEQKCVETTTIARSNTTIP